MRECLIREGKKKIRRQIRKKMSMEAGDQAKANIEDPFADFVESDSSEVREARG